MSSSDKSIEELDPNFQSDGGVIGEDGLRWIDARQLTLEGIGWPQESDAFCRLPDRTEGVVRSPVWDLSRHSAGLCVRFVTDSSTLSARWSLRNQNLAMMHMPASGVSGLDLYIRDENGPASKWRWVSIGRPEEYPQNQANLLSNQTNVLREHLLYLPLYNGVTDVQIGVEPGARLQAATRVAARKPICFYGTSIVHGGCASRPGMAYPAITSRRLDWPHYNLGFSGNGQAEPEVARLLAELDPSVFVLDPLPNLQPEMVTERMGPFVRTLREARPQTPIVLVESITYQDGWTNSSRQARYTSSNDALRAVYAGLETEVSGLHYVQGDALLGDDGEGTVDGTHPTDVGFLRMAQTLIPVLKPFLEPVL